MKQGIQKFQLSTKSTVADIYHHFCKAKNDERLDTMYEGVVKQLNVLVCTDNERRILSNDIYISYGKRQEDFDGEGNFSQTYTTDLVSSIQKDHPDLSPEEMLRQALQAL